MLVNDYLEVWDVVIFFGFVLWMFGFFNVVLLNVCWVVEGVMGLEWFSCDFVIWVVFVDDFLIMDVLLFKFFGLIEVVWFYGCFVKNLGCDILMLLLVGCDDFVGGLCSVYKLVDEYCSCFGLIDVMMFVYFDVWYEIFVEL